MTFDTADLKDRAAQLQHYAARATHPIPAGRAGVIFPNGHVGDVSGIYDDFLQTPDPASFVPLTDALKRVMSQLAPSGYTDDPSTSQGGTDVGLANPDLAAIGTTATYLSHWTGDAAEAFVSNYASQFVPVASDQFVVASVLRDAVNAEAAVWQSVRDDLDGLSQDAIDQMKHVDDCTTADCLAALSILGAVVALPFTGGTSAEIGLGVAGAGISVAGTGIGAATGGGQVDSFGLANGSPKEIISSLGDALTKLKGHIVDAEQKIVDAMTTSHDAIAASWTKLCLPEPALAMSTQGNVMDQGYAGHDA